MEREVLSPEQEHLHRERMPVALRPVRLTEARRGPVEGAARRVQESGSLRGLVLSSSPPTLCFAMRDSDTRAAALEVGRDLQIVPYAWGGIFGVCFTFTAFAPGGFVSRVAVAPTDPAFEQLRAGRFRALFFQRGHVVASCDGDYGRHEDLASYYREQFERAAVHAADLPDGDAAYWDTIRASKHLHAYLSPLDRLRVSWSERYQHLATALHEAVGAAARDPRLAHAEAPQAQLADFMRTVATGSAPAVLAHLHGLRTAGHDALLRFLLSHGEFLRFIHGVDADHEHCAVFDIAVTTYLHGPRLTRCGAVVPWLDDETRTFRDLEVRPEEFADRVQADLYWDAIPRGLRLNWGKHVTGVDVPAPVGRGSNLWSKMPEAADVPGAEAAARALLEEATTSKRGTIPAGAVLDVEFGPFAYFELWEVRDEVHAVCRTAEHEFIYAVVEPTRQFVELDGFYALQDDARRARAEAAFTLFIAAVVRDFFVVEEREQVFAERSAVPRPSRAPSVDEPRVVYLPRIRYLRFPDVPRCARDLDQHERRAHHVGAHVRRAAVAARHQLILAAHHGIPVPPGYTFVRPHERGDGERSIVYRSRSALQALYSPPRESGTTASPSAWFQFERDVQGLMRALGFRVEHVAAARGGDRGVDVYARKGDDLDEVHWIIQCKCYTSAHPVGPAVIREIVGALQSYPRGTRAMVVTTSTYTSGAREFAADQHVKLVDGDDFRRRLEQVRSQETAAKS